MHLVFDTETSGLPVAAPAAHPNQPRVMQLGAQLLDADFKVRGELNVMIAWGVEYDVHPMALKAHGITREQADCLGVTPEQALAIFYRFVISVGSNNAAAFNSRVDFQLVNIMAAQVKQPAIFNILPYCPMLALTPVIKLPGRYPGQFKWPSLQEAHVFCTGKPFDGAHDAMADVRALAKVYEWCRKNLGPPEQTLPPTPAAPKTLAPVEQTQVLFE